MAVYIIALLITLALAWIGMHTPSYQRGKKASVIFFSALPLFLLAALRYGIGTDYHGYIRSIETVSRHGVRGNYEPLYGRIVTIILYLKLHPQWLIAICAAIYIYVVFISIFRDSPYPLLSIFLFFGSTYYFIGFNAVRQILGCVFLLYSLKYIESKEFKKFLLCVLIAGGFHYSALLFVVVYFLAGIKFTPAKTFFFTVSFFSIESALIKLIRILIVNTKYAVYLDDFGGSFNPRSIPGMAVQLAVLLLALIEYKPSPRYNACFGAQLIATWVTILGTAIPWSNRIKWIFGIPILWLIPAAVEHIADGRKRSFVVMGIVVCFGIYAYVMIGIFGSQGVVPYVSVFQK